ncbi:hypothetical protein XA68_17000 [Ophiocordyceps unilateralis]|uniref:Uncharacterized protein n=1 Tax=Ophiocordyceps unilateralis TaxID=268505 RepID=A0A2A9P5M1_OPHUN|nr:hypothetical protein XA68_17000 [Ophiocordyceps unilateralis]
MIRPDTCRGYSPPPPMPLSQGNHYRSPKSFRFDIQLTVQLMKRGGCECADWEAKSILSWYLDSTGYDDRAAGPGT